MPPALQCQNLHFSDNCVIHNIAKSVHIDIGKQEAVTERSTGMQ